MVTIYDVAKRAGVSKTLVSRVLNNQSGVSPESRSRIREAMKELHYKPNTLARSLVLQRTNVVGVILDSLTEQYFFDVIRGVEDTVKENHFRVIFCSGRNDRGEKENYIDFFSNGATDGAIIYGSDLDDADLIRKRAEMEFPFVVVENEVEDANVNNVLVDNTYGSKLAVDHLVKKGCRRIMHVTGAKGTKAALRRWQGYLAAMEQQGLAQYISVVECQEFGVDQGYEAVKTWLMGHGREELPDAIYFGADNTAFGGMIALEEAGIDLHIQSQLFCKSLAESLHNAQTFFINIIEHNLFYRKLFLSHSHFVQQFRGIGASRSHNCKFHSLHMIDLLYCLCSAPHFPIEKTHPSYVPVSVVYRYTFI